MNSVLQKINKSKPLILIIEDNSDVALFLISCLESGYQVEIAKDGQEGIDKAIDVTPDIVISDVMMPNPN